MSAPALLLALALLAAPAVGAPRDVTFPPRPPSGQRIVDEAGWVGVRERAAIREICDRLQHDLRIPLRLVTLRSLTDYGAEGWGLPRYAVKLFEEWALESYEPEAATVDWERGMLVIVSALDAEARVELGDEWSGHHRTVSRDVLHRLVLPELEAGRPSEALLLAARGLEAMALNDDLPAARSSWRALAWKLLVASAALTTAVAAIVRGGPRGAMTLWRSWIWAPFDRVDQRTLDEESEARRLLAESSGSAGRW